MLAIGLIVTDSFARHVGAFAFLIAFGWLSGLVLAKLYKIVAFLTWLETYGPAMGRAPTPRVQDLVAERRAAKWFAVYFVSAWGATAALLLGQPIAFRIAVLAMTAATAGHRAGTDPDTAAGRRGRAAAPAARDEGAAASICPN